MWSPAGGHKARPYVERGHPGAVFRVLPASKLCSPPRRAASAPRKIREAVIPAQAGIHIGFNSRAWIPAPAFAGVTTLRGNDSAQRIAPASSLLPA